MISNRNKMRIISIICTFGIVSNIFAAGPIYASAEETIVEENTITGDDAIAESEDDLKEGENGVPIGVKADPTTISNVGLPETNNNTTPVKEQPVECVHNYIYTPSSATTHKKVCLLCGEESIENCSYEYEYIENEFVMTCSFCDGVAEDNESLDLEGNTEYAASLFSETSEISTFSLERSAIGSTTIDESTLTQAGTWLGAPYALLDEDGDGVNETCYVYDTMTDTTGIWGSEYVASQQNYQTYGFYKVLTEHPDVTKAIVNCSLGNRKITTSLFDSCSNLISLEFGTKFDTGNITNMSYMFRNCSSLTSLNISKFNTSSARSLSGMFYGCSSLTCLDLSNFDTSNVIYISSMFYNCSSLLSLDLSNFNTSNVTSLYGMFYNCKSLTSLDLSNIDTSKVKNMSEMFYNCSSLTSLDLSYFDTSNVTDMSWMFYNCSSLTLLSVSNFNTSNVNNMRYMFRSCSSLTSLDMSNFDMSSVTSYTDMFFGTDKLEALKTPNTNPTEGITLPKTMYTHPDNTAYTSLPVTTGTSLTLHDKELKLCAEGKEYSVSDALVSWDISLNEDGSVMAYLFDTDDDSVGDTVVLDGVGETVEFNAEAKSDTQIRRNNYTYDINDRGFGYKGTNTYYAAPWTFPQYKGNIKHFYFTDNSDIAFGNAAYLFYNMSKLESIKFDKVSFSNATDMHYMFRNCSSLTSLNLSNFNTSKVTDMGLMFGNCTSLASLDLSNFVTSNVTNMEYMFSSCKKLETLDLRNFDTSNVTNMSHMFYECKALTSLEFGNNFNTSNVTTMECMFYYCNKLTSLDIRNFNTSNVTNMGSVFYNCSSLTSLDISNFDTSNVTNMGLMFYRCSSLTSLNLSNFDTSKVTGMSWMFYGCSSLTSLDMSNFDMSSVTSYTDMFFGTDKLEALKTPNTNPTEGITLPKTMYTHPDNTAYTSLPVTTGNSLTLHDKELKLCAEGKEYNISDALVSWDISLNEDGSVMAYLFDTDADSVGDTVVLDGVGETVGFNAEAESETKICNNRDVYNINHRGFGYKKDDSTYYYAAPWTFPQYKGNVKYFYFTDNSNIAFGNAAYLFYNMSKLESIKFDKASFSNVTDMKSMFEGCSLLTSLDVSNFDTSNVMYMRSMFSGCSSLTTLNLSSFNTSNVTDMYSFFYKCSSLTSLDLSSFDTSNVTNMYGMFRECSSLTSLDVSNFDTSNVTNMCLIFDDCRTLTSLNLSNFDTSKVTNMFQMFYNCNSLTSIDLSNFDTSKVTNMCQMFTYCSSLTSLKFGTNFNTSNVADMSSMFSYCSSLSSLDVSNFNTSNVTNMKKMFFSCSSLTTLGISNFNTSKVTNMSYMFYGCSSLTTLDLSNFDASKVTDMSYMFYYCSSFASLDLKSFNMGGVTQYDKFIDGTKNLQKFSAPSRLPLDIDKSQKIKFASLMEDVEDPNSVTDVLRNSFAGTTLVRKTKYMVKAPAKLVPQAEEGSFDIAAAINTYNKDMGLEVTLSNCELTNQDDRKLLLVIGNRNGGKDDVYKINFAPNREDGILWESVSTVLYYLTGEPYAGTYEGNIILHFGKKKTASMGR